MTYPPPHGPTLPRVRVFGTHSEDPSAIVTKSDGKLRIGLDACRPNPFSSEVEIAYSASGMTVSTGLSLGVYDASGRLVRALLVGLPGLGQHSVVWDGTDEVGRPVQSGAYFCRLRAGRNTYRQLILLVR